MTTSPKSVDRSSLEIHARAAEAARVNFVGGQIHLETIPAMMASITLGSDLTADSWQRLKLTMTDMINSDFNLASEEAKEATQRELAANPDSDPANVAAALEQAECIKVNRIFCMDTLLAIVNAFERSEGRETKRVERLERELEATERAFHKAEEAKRLAAMTAEEQQHQAAKNAAIAALTGAKMPAVNLPVVVQAKPPVQQPKATRTPADKRLTQERVVILIDRLGQRYTRMSACEEVLGFILNPPDGIVYDEAEIAALCDEVVTSVTNIFFVEAGGNNLGDAERDAKQWLTRGLTFFNQKKSRPIKPAAKPLPAPVAKVETPKVETKTTSEETVTTDTEPTPAKPERTPEEIAAFQAKIAAEQAAKDTARAKTEADAEKARQEKATRLLQQQAKRNDPRFGEMKGAPVAKKGEGKDKKNKKADKRQPPAEV